LTRVQYSKAVALPHDLQVVVTDKLPKGIDGPTTEVDGRTIFWPAAFSKATHDVLTGFLPDVIASKSPPRAISQENFASDVLNVWGNQFILGHEFGHAVIHQLNVPLTGLEEDSADGFATFFTVNDKGTGPNAERCSRRGGALRGHGQQETQSDSGAFLQRSCRDFAAAV